MLQSLTDQLVTTGVSNPDRRYPLPRLDISATEGQFWRSLHLVGKYGSSSSPFYGLIMLLNSSELYVTELFLTHQTKIQSSTAYNSTTKVPGSPRRCAIRMPGASQPTGYEHLYFTKHGSIIYMKKKEND